MHTSLIDGTYDGWAGAARAALTAGHHPESVDWLDASTGDTGGLWQTVEEPAAIAPTSAFRVPKSFVEIAREVSCHRDTQRWSILYRVLWRLTHGEPHLMEITVDPDLRKLQEMQKSVHRDVHKMRAFVRFREVATSQGTWFVAWFEPEHHILQRNASFFRDRFASMCWSILTPEKCMHWDGAELRFTAGVDRSQAPTEDAVEDLWLTYYASIFNPARVKEKTMRGHMAPKYWKNLPEAREIPTLLERASVRVEEMHQVAAAKRPILDFVPFDIPAEMDLAGLAAAQSCRGCPLWKHATCAVFGEGPVKARIVAVGEQPGDQEDRARKPFVGPAGQLLNRAFVAAGIDRSQLYVTNAVKHFKWTPKGKQRIHAKPSAREVAACRPWLEAEIRRVQPEVILCLGATAAQSVCGSGLRVTELRGQTVGTEFGIPALITVHPSSLLRLPPDRDPAAEFDLFVADLKRLSTWSGRGTA
jgi:uracil-DNA glycosylase